MNKNHRKYILPKDLVAIMSFTVSKSNAFKHFRKFEIALLQKFFIENLLIKICCSPKQIMMVTEAIIIVYIKNVNHLSILTSQSKLLARLLAVIWLLNTLSSNLIRFSTVQKMQRSLDIYHESAIKP